MVSAEESLEGPPFEGDRRFAIGLKFIYEGHAKHDVDFGRTLCLVVFYTGQSIHVDAGLREHIASQVAP